MRCSGVDGEPPPAWSKANRENPLSKRAGAAVKRIQTRLAGLDRAGTLSCPVVARTMYRKGELPDMSTENALASLAGTSDETEFYTPMPAGYR